MSSDLSSVQDQMVTDEFIDNLISLSVSQSLTTHADDIELLHIQLQRAIPDGLNKNKLFALKLIENLYRIVPLFGKILSNNDKNDPNDFIQTKLFLETLANAFNDVCLFEIFTILNDGSPIQFIFQNYIFLLKETYFVDNNIYDNLVNCLLPILAYSNVLTPVTEDKMPLNLVTYLLKFTKRHLLNPNRETLVRNILCLIKSFSKNPTLVPMIIRTEWPHACVQWLSNQDDVNRLRPSYSIDYYICLIIQKLARHTIGVQILNQLNCLKRLDECKEHMKKCHTELEYNCLHVLQCMIYALLMEADEIKQLSLLNDTRMCHVINELVLYTIQASRAEFFFYRCFHISEMLSVLSKLFVNDDILLKSINENNQLFDCLCQLMIHFANLICDTSRTHQPPDNETLISLTNLLWSISFHPCYHEKFQANTMLLNILSMLTTTSLCENIQIKLIPRDICSLKKASEGILWNLKLSTSNQILKNVKTEQQPLAMISYSHSDATFCRELVEQLSSCIPVWVDYKQARDSVAHSDDLWEEIARAMETATVIVLIISKEYYDSKSCRQELSYASDALKKRIVPIYPPNQQYKANGWLGIRIAGQKYIHFGRKPFTEAIKELSSIIYTDQKPTVLSSSSSSSQPVTRLSSATTSIKIIEEENKLLILKNWTTKDIRKWFEDNHIHKDLITLYINEFQTGTSLIVYARHLKLLYRNEYLRIYKIYSKTFHKKKLNTLDFITFADALYRLRNEYDPNSTIEDTYEKCSEQQLPCIIKTCQECMTRL